MAIAVSEAVARYQTALRLYPDDAELHDNLAHALSDLGRLAEAAASCRELVRLRPGDPSAHLKLGSVLRSLGRAAEAAECYREALRLRPDYPEALSNLGNALYDLGHPHEAVASFRAALRLRPDDAEIHTNLAYALLLGGKLTEGWSEYEWRWKTSGLSRAVRDFAAPLWNGDAIGDRVILLHAEQGLGDTLHFCRYVPLVAARRPRSPGGPGRHWHGLLAQLPGNAAITVQGEPLPAFDLHCPLISLPRAFGTTLETIAAPIPYLWAPHKSVARGASGLQGSTGRAPDWSGPAVDGRTARNAAVELAPFVPTRDAGAAGRSLRR